MLLVVYFKSMSETSMRKSWEGEHPQYTKYELDDGELPASPWLLWDAWQSEARAVVQHTNEVAISTCGSVAGEVQHLQPTVRMVLLKYYDEALGFCWYSKACSEKGKQLSEVPHVELLWYVKELQRQVRVRGSVSTTSAEEAEKYARSRPRKSQISAYVSRQSSVIESRAALERAYKNAEVAYENEPIPVAEDWTGYVLKPARFEFWQGREDRLHDRIVYTCADAPHGTWSIIRLQP